MRLAEPLEGWAEYQSVLQYIRFYGRELRPTARLILLTLIGHEAPNDHDRKANEYAMEHGLRVLSAHTLRTGEKIWIITEADRSSTTILFGIKRRGHIAT